MKLLKLNYEILLIFDYFKMYVSKFILFVCMDWIVDLGLDCVLRIVYYKL